MQERSIHDLVRTVVSIPVAAKTDGAENGAGQDGYDADAKMFQIVLGTWTDGSHVFTFEESDDAATWTQIPAADLDEKTSGDLDVADPDQVTVDDNSRADSVLSIGYIGGKRHTRVVRNSSGSTTGLVAGALVVESRLRSRGKTPMSPDWQ